MGEELKEREDLKELWVSRRKTFSSILIGSVYWVLRIKLTNDRFAGENTNVYSHTHSSPSYLQFPFLRF